jgi:hypothetical protein
MGIKKAYILTVFLVLMFIAVSLVNSVIFASDNQHQWKQTEINKLTNCIVRIEQDLIDGQLTQKDADLLIDMQLNAIKSVLLCP